MGERRQASRALPHMSNLRHHKGHSVRLAAFSAIAITGLLSDGCASPHSPPARTVHAPAPVASLQTGSAEVSGKIGGKIGVRKNWGQTPIH
jgi:hypothetical protein